MKRIALKKMSVDAVMFLADEVDYFVKNPSPHNDYFINICLTDIGLKLWISLRNKYEFSHKPTVNITLRPSEAALIVMCMTNPHRSDSNDYHKAVRSSVMMQLDRQLKSL